MRIWIFLEPGNFWQYGFAMKKLCHRLVAGMNATRAFFNQHPNQAETCKSWMLTLPLFLFALILAMPGCCHKGKAKCSACASASSTPTSTTPIAPTPTSPTPPAPPAPPVAAKSPAVAAPAAPMEDEVVMFDGKTLKGWAITPFAGKGDVEIKDEAMILNMGVMTGVNYTNTPPKMDYEVEWEARRVEGSDFFTSLTFLVGEAPCTLIIGGWGGGVVGLSSIDNMDASENETSKYTSFQNGKWYKFRLRVTKKKIEAWIDQDKVIDFKYAERKISMRPGEIEQSAPFGFATWSSTGAIRDVVLRKVKEN